MSCYNEDKIEILFKRACISSWWCYNISHLWFNKIIGVIFVCLIKEWEMIVLIETFLCPLSAKIMIYSTMMHYSYIHVWDCYTFIKEQYNLFSYILNSFLNLLKVILCLLLSKLYSDFRTLHPIYAIKDLRFFRRKLIFRKWFKITLLEL